MPIVVVEYLISGSRVIKSAQEPLPPTRAVFVSFAVAGLCGELGKSWVVKASLGRSPYLADPLQGLTFSSAVALSYSFLESVIDLVTGGPALIDAQAVLCTLGHVAFSALWGFCAGMGTPTSR